MIIFGVELFCQSCDPLGGIDRKGVLTAHTIAVGPVCCDAGFSDIVHLHGAYLNLDAFPVAARHCCVDRPVPVCLGLADVILEPPRHRTPSLVDRAQCPVTVFFALRDDPEPVDV